MIEVGKVKSGQFKAEFFSGALTHALSSSTPLTITPPAGKTLRLDYLSSQSGIYPVSLVIGSTTVISNKVLFLRHDVTSGTFVISNGIAGGASGARASNTVQPLIAFESDQSITITQADPNSDTIFYSYSYGE